MLSDGPSSSSGGKAIQSWKPRVRPGSPAPPPCQTPPPARIHSRPPVRNKPVAPFVSSLADAALGNVGKGCDAGMWMKPETRERFSLIIDKVEKYEGFQKTAKVGRRHEAGDGPVTLAPGPSGDASNGRVFGFYKKPGFAFLNSVCRVSRPPYSRPSPTTAPQP